MRPKTILPLLLICALCCQGCSTWRPIDAGLGGSAGPIEVGQRIQVVDRDGEGVDIRVTAVGANFVEGRAGDDALLRFAIDGDARIERRERAPGKTAGLVVGLIFARAVIGAAIVGAGGAAVLSAGGM